MNVVGDRLVISKIEDLLVKLVDKICEVNTRTIKIEKLCNKEKEINIDMSSMSQNIFNSINEKLLTDFEKEISKSGCLADRFVEAIKDKIENSSQTQIRDNVAEPQMPKRKLDEKETKLGLPR